MPAKDSSAIGTVAVVVLALGCIAVLLFMVVIPYALSTSRGRHCSIHDPCGDGKREAPKIYAAASSY